LHIQESLQSLFRFIFTFNVKVHFVWQVGSTLSRKYAVAANDSTFCGNNKFIHTAEIHSSTTKVIVFISMKSLQIV